MACLATVLVELGLKKERRKKERKGRKKKKERKKGKEKKKDVDNTCYQNSSHHGN